MRIENVPRAFSSMVRRAVFLFSFFFFYREHMVRSIVSWAIRNAVKLATYFDFIRYSPLLLPWLVIIERVDR